MDSDGKTHYADHDSRITTFDRPEGLVGELPAGWELLRSPEGVAYFAGHNTHTTTWRDPSNDGFDESDADTVGAKTHV